MNELYYAEVINKIDNGQGYWNSLNIGIFKTVDGNKEQIGEYIRNYHCLFNSFHPFMQGDKWYALYSKEYTATRVMSLPDCKDLCGEDSDGDGFCPVDFYVPWDNKDLSDELKFSKEQYPDSIVRWTSGSFGFVSGCIWGDDSGWKLEFLDLREITNSKLIRDDRFGYIDIGGKRIKDSVDFDYYYLDGDNESCNISIYGRALYNWEKNKNI